MQAYLTTGNHQIKLTTPEADDQANAAGLVANVRAIDYSTLSVDSQCFGDRLPKDGLLLCPPYRCVCVFFFLGHFVSWCPCFAIAVVVLMLHHHPSLLGAISLGLESFGAMTASILIFGSWGRHATFLPWHTLVASYTLNATGLRRKLVKI